MAQDRVLLMPSLYPEFAVQTCSLADRNPQALPVNPVPTTQIGAKNAPC